jgi:ATP-dependent 26S proteasome regulatory subunit
MTHPYEKFRQPPSLAKSSSKKFDQKGMAEANALEKALEKTQDVGISQEILNLSADEIKSRAKLIENETRYLKTEINRLNSEIKGYQEKIKENLEKIKLNKGLPHLVGNVVEVNNKIDIN